MTGRDVDVFSWAGASGELLRYVFGVVMRFGGVNGDSVGRKQRSDTRITCCRC